MLLHRACMQEYMDVVAVASGEYLDPRFDGVPLEWDEHDDFDALRSVEADVALTLQVLTHHLRVFILTVNLTTCRHSVL